MTVTTGSSPAPQAADNVIETVDVIAPSNLPEGYQFQVDPGSGGPPLLVQVPPGGVTEGQRFAAIVLATTGLSPNASPTVPTGAWRDEWTNCCAHGWVHPQCCLACWCWPCAVGQIMTRLNLDWKADTFDSEADKPSLSTFYIVMIIVAIYHIIAHVFSIASLGFLETVFFVLFAVYWTLIACKTRQKIRHAYRIPTTVCDCGGGESGDNNLEDCCCSFWCAPCTACHMARHLTDYETTRAECCTETGLPLGSPPLPEFAIPAGIPRTTANTTTTAMPPAPPPPTINEVLQDNAALETPGNDDEAEPGTTTYRSNEGGTYVVDV